MLPESIFSGYQLRANLIVFVAKWLIRHVYILSHNVLHDLSAFAILSQSQFQLLKAEQDSNLVVGKSVTWLIVYVVQCPFIQLFDLADKKLSWLLTSRALSGPGELALNLTRLQDYVLLDSVQIFSYQKWSLEFFYD